MTNPYDQAFEQSIKDPDGFWGEVAENCHWYKKWDKVLDDSRKPFFRWFSGGQLNTCFNALDVHIENGLWFCMLSTIMENPSFLAAA